MVRPLDMDPSWIHDLQTLHILQVLTIDHGNVGFPTIFVAFPETESRTTNHC